MTFADKSNVFIMQALKKALLANAVFSMSSGAVLIIFHQGVAQLFEVENEAVFWIVGLGLLMFSASVFYEARQLRRVFVFSIIIQDLLWVLASVILLIWDPFGISVSGQLLIGFIALIVLIFALVQANASLEGRKNETI